MNTNIIYKSNRSTYLRSSFCLDSTYEIESFFLHIIASVLYKYCIEETVMGHDKDGDIKIRFKDESCLPIIFKNLDNIRLDILYKLCTSLLNSFINDFGIYEGIGNLLARIWISDKYKLIPINILSRSINKYSSYTRDISILELSKLLFPYGRYTNINGENIDYDIIKYIDALEVIDIEHNIAYIEHDKPLLTDFNISDIRNTIEELNFYNGITNTRKFFEYYDGRYNLIGL